MQIDIPPTIREEDKKNLETIIEMLDTEPFVQVAVPADENPGGYAAIKVYVKPQLGGWVERGWGASEDCPEGTFIGSPGSTDPYWCASEDCPEGTPIGNPRLTASLYTFGILQKIADRGTYNENLSRNNPLRYLEGEIRIERKGTKCIIYYTEDAESTLDGELFIQNEDGSHEYHVGRMTPIIGKTTLEILDEGTVVAAPAELVSPVSPIREFCGDFTESLRIVYREIRSHLKR